MVEDTAPDPTTLMAEATAELSVEEEALPELVQPMAHETVAGTTTVEAEFQIPTWNLGERIPIKPQIWDANTPQIGAGEADDDVDIIMEMVDTLTPMIEDQAPEENIAREHMDTERETVPVSPSSSPVTTEATTVVATTTPAGPTVHSTREDANEIMLMLEKTMEKVCEWSERVEAQTAAIAGREVAIWKRRLANCEESLKRKGTDLTEAEKAQAELRKALEAKDAKLAKVRAELDAERGVVVEGRKAEQTLASSSMVEASGHG
jgi:hypothetical protein